MRIKQFNLSLREEAQPHILKNCKLVIDAQNYFYTMYDQSGLSSIAGCESDRFAQYLKEHLSKFKQANVECYFVFKGGSQNVEKKFNKKNHSNEICSPIFTKNICKQVLDEMGFDYVTCVLESKQQCAVIADKLECPVLSNDIEIAIMTNLYINYLDIMFDPALKAFRCKLIRFRTFLQKTHLSIEQFEIFVLLTDQNIYPEGHFLNLLSLNLQVHLEYPYLDLFKWLSEKSPEEALDQILQGFDADNQKDIRLKMTEIHALLTIRAPGTPYQYFLEKNKISVQEMDEQWFEKGIACRYIPLAYIYLYRNSIVESYFDYYDASKPDVILLSMDIIKYAFNLLTNYNRDTIEIRSKANKISKINANMTNVPKPNYPAGNVVFQNGWEHIKQYKLLEHFLKHTINDANLGPLEELPSDARLLMVTLLYVAHNSDAWGAYEAYSVMTSYVVLCNKRFKNNALQSRNDSSAATKALATYFSAKRRYSIPSADVLYPLLQFQHCLEQMNNLNALCGFPFKATIFSKTYNGTLAYNILRELKQSEKDAFTHIWQLLKSAPTTVGYLKKLANTHTKITPFKN